MRNILNSEFHIPNSDKRFALIDADAFFASSLQRRRPDLIGKPIFALGMGGGCVIAASYEAKACGVKTGMQLTEAKQLCPQAVALPSDFSEALKASREIESILLDHCPIMERASVDEWYLDILSVPRANRHDLAQWARDVQATVKRKTALSVSVGLGPTKLLAKMAAEYRKPAGVTLIGPLDISLDAFLRDRPAAAIPGIGKRHSLHTSSFGWQTAYDFAYADTQQVKQFFGKVGLELQKELQGEPVWDIIREAVPPKSISRCRSFRASNETDLIFSHLLDHLTYTVMKLRRHKLMCTRISVWLRNGEYKSEGRESKLPQPMDTEEQLLPYLQFCFERLHPKVPRCTQVGLALAGFKSKASVQYSLFDDPDEIEATLNVQAALDAVHEKYGRDLLKRGSAMATNTGSKKKGLHVINPF